jgi:type I restriction enzyme, R subunit
MSTSPIVPIGDRHSRKNCLRPDYVLFIRQNIPIAVVEAKAEYAQPDKGLQQAIQYAEMLNVKFAYSSNGKGIVEHDFITGMECDLDAFPQRSADASRHRTRRRSPLGGRVKPSPR